MTAMIQIRNVPDGLHRRLKARAAIEGISMSQFIMREIEKALEHPSRKELLDAISKQSETKLDIPPAEILGKERDAR